MKETPTTQKLMQQLRIDLRGCEMIKHHGGMTNSVPDLSVSWLGDTYWIENKILRPGETVKDIVRPKQLIKAQSLHITTMGKCWYTIYEEEPRQLHIMTPAAVARRAWPRLIFGTNYTTMHPNVGDQTQNLWLMLRAYGHLVVNDWNHAAVTRVIRGYAGTHSNAATV